MDLQQQVYLETVQLCLIDVKNFEFPLASLGIPCVPVSAPGMQQYRRPCYTLCLATAAAKKDSNDSKGGKRPFLEGTRFLER